MSRNPAKILFVCTGNASRSQMSEAIFRQMAGDKAEVHSAGVIPSECVDPTAKKLLEGRGIDMSKATNTHVNSLTHIRFDIVVTIGAGALNHPPELPGNPRRMHWNIPDASEELEMHGVDGATKLTAERIEERLKVLLKQMEEFPRSSELHHAPGISTSFVRPDRFEPAKHMPLIADAGFKCIELNCALGSKDFAYDCEDKIDELVEASKQTGVRIYSVHSPGEMFNLPGWSYAKHRGAIDMLKYFADLAVQLGADVIPVHAWPTKFMGREEGDALLRDALKELENHILEMPCRYAWENEFPDHTATEHLEWLRTLNPSSFGFVLDNGHCNLIGQDIGMYLPAASWRLCDLHLNDNDGTKDQHAIPGEGTFDWDGFLSKLDQADYVGPLMLEIVGQHGRPDLKTILTDTMQSLKRIT